MPLARWAPDKQLDAAHASPCTPLSHRDGRADATIEPVLDTGRPFPRRGYEVVFVDPVYCCFELHCEHGFEREWEGAPRFHSPHGETSASTEYVDDPDQASFGRCWSSPRK